MAAHTHTLAQNTHTHTHTQNKHKFLGDVLLKFLVCSYLVQVTEGPMWPTCIWPVHACIRAPQHLR